MSLQGSHYGLLDDLHASGCDGTEYSACRPFVVPAEDGTFIGRTQAADLQVIFMTWCSECGAADWDYV